jgi:hypothetical protein
MNADTKKRWRTVILRSMGAVFLAWAVVMAGVGLLSRYGVASEEAFLPHRAIAIRFPENEKMLNDVTASLARDGAALSKVEPAAGKK